MDAKLFEVATEAERKILHAIQQTGGVRPAAAALGKPHSTVRLILRRVEQKAGLSRDVIRNRAAAEEGAEPYFVKGTSTLYDQSGNVRAQWVKTSLDHEKFLENVERAFTSLADSVPRMLPQPKPSASVPELLNLYTITDAHVGMLAWHREGGADWDLKIAEKVLIGCFEAMVMQSPPAGTAIINQLGDFLHYDSFVAQTPTSGHPVDADGRLQKMVEVAIRILRRMVDIALLRHNHVHIKLAEGNHDMTSSVWLRVMFKALYENEPRVTVDDSALPYYTYQHGETMLGFAHGHLRKRDSLPLLFAAQFPKIWGSTTKRYVHTGHEHHEDIKEHSGVKVIQHPTLAARDAYAARGGWLSERAATAYTYHNVWGQVGSVTVTPEMLAA